MFERSLVCVPAAIMLAVGLPLAAQSENFAERERALARDLAAEQEAEESERAFARDLELQQRELAAQQRELVAQQEEQERAFAREVEQQQRELAAQREQHQRSYAREREAQHRELTAQQEQQQRSFARDFEAQQRAFAEQQRAYAESSAQMQRELARAKSQLAVSAAEIARLSAQISEPAMVDVQNRLRDLDRLRNLGQRGVLGIGIDDTELGVRVESVSPNGPAAAAGVAVGDTIVAVNGFELGSEADRRVDSPSAAFLGQLAEVEPGQEVELRILRDGDARDIVVRSTENSWAPFRLWTVEPQRLQGRQGVQGRQGQQGQQGQQGAPRVTVLPNGPESIFMAFQRPWSDIELVTLTPALGEYFGTDAGLLVVRAGRMGELGLRDGDVILDIGGREPQTPEHAMRILSSFEPEEPIPMSVMRQSRRETLRITVPEETVGWYTGNSGDIWVTGPPRPQRRSD